MSPSRHPRLRSLLSLVEVAALLALSGPGSSSLSAQETDYVPGVHPEWARRNPASHREYMPPVILAHGDGEPGDQHGRRPKTLFASEHNR
ncbi:MAG: hypothetical protein ACE5GJ_14025 [Gemmatimonadota bacterium]